MNYKWICRRCKHVNEEKQSQTSMAGMFTLTMFTFGLYLLFAALKEIFAGLDGNYNSANVESKCQRCKSSQRLFWFSPPTKQKPAWAGFFSSSQMLTGLKALCSFCYAKFTWQLNKSMFDENLYQMIYQIDFVTFFVTVICDSFFHRFLYFKPFFIKCHSVTSVTR